MTKTQTLNRARKIIMDMYEANQIRPLFNRKLLHPDPDFDRTYMKEEFLHHIFHRLLDLCDKDPSRVIRLYEQEGEGDDRGLMFYCCGIIRNELRDANSRWNVLHKSSSSHRKTLLLYGDCADLDEECQRRLKWWERNELINENQRYERDS